MAARKLKQQMPPIKFEQYDFLRGTQTKPILASLQRVDLFMDNCSKDVIHQESLRQKNNAKKDTFVIKGGGKGFGRGLGMSHPIMDYKAIGGKRQEELRIKMEKNGNGDAYQFLEFKHFDHKADEIIDDMEYEGALSSILQQFR